MRCQLAIVVCVLLVCSFLAYYAPHFDASIKATALRAFEGNLLAMVDGVDDSGVDKVWKRPQYRDTSRSRPGRPPAPLGGGAKIATAVRAGDSPKGSTAARRKRITPFISKKVAARQNFRCAMCGNLLTEDWEIDHIVPLHARGSPVGTASKFENDLDGLQALHKRCHLLKSSMEQRSA